MENADRFQHGKSQKHLLGRSFTLLRDFQQKELTVLPESWDASSISPQSVYEFRCGAPSVRIGTTSVHSIRCPLSLKVHCSFLGKNAGELDEWAQPKTCYVNDPVAIELAHGLMDTSSNVRIGSDTLLYMVQMLCARLEHPLIEANNHPALSRFEDWQVAELTQSLSLAMEQGLSIAFIAGRCRLSVCHFSRLFKATYGRPLHKFLVNERIKRAQARLASTTEPIAQIALDCGFADQSSFTRRFTAVTGTPPAVWRKQAGHGRAANVSCSDAVMQSDCVTSQW